ncbi:hypothetical protein HPB50_009270 [Hyalomma asiaticum]|uniref:Uncharacterized protein n=1 Tax=Hyalomma asiaticum TaxID=266040 RepID=A0ACB7RYZ4_HYAAI|nr:hypothetical protein HPB50_009270 [Hyalomma asiaticum]
MITDRPGDGSHKVVSKKGTHASHAPDVCRLTVLRTQEGIKALAAASGEAPVKIVQQVTAYAPASSRQHLPSDEALRQIVRRKRKADCPHEPFAVQELIVEGEFRTTLDGREFLRCDCTSPDGAQLLIFFTDENIRKLNDAPIWLMDGTFKTVSALFEQLYTIHGYLHGHVFPFVYCLMTRRTQVAYEALFEEVLNFAADMGLALNPKTVSTDFELAAINAIRTTLFPQEASDLLRWWEENYLLGKSRRRVAGGNSTVVIRTPPIFPPSLWNVLALTQDGFPTGNNAVEAWHRRWEILVGAQHVSVFRVITTMKREQARVENNIEGAIRGQPRRLQSKKQKLRESRLAAALANRDNVDVLSFLRGIAHNLSV